MSIKAIRIQKGDRTNIYFNLSSYPFLIRSNIKEMITVMFKIINEQLTANTREIIRKFNHDKIENTHLYTYQNTNTTILLICSDKVKYERLKLFMQKLNVAQDKPNEDTILQNSEQFINEKDKIDHINMQLEETNYHGVY